MPKLVIKKDDLYLKKISIPEDILAFTVGAEQGNDIIIKDESVSFFHLQFEKQDNTYYVRDLQSQWGTFVNGQKIINRTIVNNNDEIGVGTHNIIFSNPGNNTKSSFYAKSFDTKQTSSINDKISGVPVLENLNSWIHKDNKPLENNEDVLIETEENREYDIANRYYDTIPSDSSFNIPQKNNAPEQNSLLNFADKNESDYQDPVFNFEAKPLIKPKQAESPEKYLDEKITPVHEIKKSSRSEVDNYCLLCIHGYYLGRVFKLKASETRIGRDRKLNDIVIKKNSRGKIDQSVSRRQATITKKNNILYISDKRSKSRTFVNQQKLTKQDEIQINPGDEIEIISDRKSHIFRLVRKDELDFSFPHQAGAWHIRNRIKILNIYSIIILLLASFIFGKFFLTRNKITHRPLPLTVNETVWYSDAFESEIMSKQAPSTSYYPAIADFNGDKIIDLIFIDEDGFLQCINGKSKEILWINIDFQSMANLPVTVEDLNENDIPDVIVVSEDSRLRAIDGKWGIEIWKSPILAGPLIGPPVVGDFDGDGLKDLAITSFDNAVYIGFSSLKNSHWIKIDTETQVRSVATAADLTGNGILNVLIGTESGKILVIDGIQKKISGEININEEFSKASGSYYQNNQIRNPMALGDLNGDSTNDLIVSTIQGNIMVLNGSTLERLWYDLNSPDSIVEQSMNHNIALGDLDGDNLLDIVSLTPAGRLRAFKGLGQGKDRKMILWDFPAKENEYFVSSPVLADFNKNGTMDVITANNLGYIFIIEGATGSILWQNNQNNFTVVSPPLIGDIDSDSRLDILAIKSDGKVHKFDTNSLILDNTVVWGQMFGNSRHTSISSFKVQSGNKFFAYMVISLLVNLCIIVLHIVFRNKRKKLSQIQEFI